MTLEQKLKELKAGGFVKGDTYEVFETVEDKIVIQVFTSTYSFEEYVFTKTGDFISHDETDLYR